MVHQTRDAEPEALDIVIESGSLTAAEAAAVTAVVSAAVREEASASRPEATTPVGAWQKSQRCLRDEIVPGPGAWRAS